MIGQTISHYEITAKLGEGGMGVVYKAEDTKLKRAVALKFLAAHLLQDEEARERFHREAQAAAALDHPNICTVYEIDEAEGETFLAMAFIEGRTVKDKISDRPLKLEEAVDIAAQTAEGLKAAHQRGVVHRDIKPANLMLTEEDQVKIMDFGLAQLAEQSRLTKASTTLGTPAYMSPEQAERRPTDRRTDMWSLGVVLYEMVTGRLPFGGERQEAVLYAISNQEPEPVTALRAGLPMELEFIVGKALAKDPAERYQHVEEMIVDLRGLVKRAQSTLTRPASAARAAAPASPGTHSLITPPPATEPAAAEPARKPLALIALPVAIAAAAVFYSFWMMERSQPEPAHLTTRTVVNLPDSAQLALGTVYPLAGFDSPALALSPDGRHLVYVGQAENGTRLYHRDLTRFEDPRPIPDTEEALYAFFSPDSSELGFLTVDRVKKVTLNGGAAATLCRVRGPVSATWIGDVIYFTEREGSVLSSVPAAGGEPSQIVDSVKRLGDLGDVSAVLPGSGAAFVSVFPEESISSDYAEIRVVSLEGGEDKPLGITGFDARYLPSGHLVFGRRGSLLAAPFDLERLEVTGDAIPVLAGMALESMFHQVHAAFADNGTVAFVSGGDLSRGRLAWVDRQGNEGVLDIPERVYGSFDIAPDDDRFAIQVGDVRDYVWIWSAKDGGRAVSGSASVGWPVWSPDGNAFAGWSKEPGGGGQVFIHEIRTGAVRDLFSSEGRVMPSSWVRPGLIGITDLGRDVSVLSVDSPQDRPWVRRQDEGGLGIWGTTLSPDGAFVAYGSDEGGGRLQIWFEAVDGGDRGQVSTDGGMEPVWCRACDELFYRWGNRVFASRVTRKPRLEIGTPRVVFELPDFVDTPGISFRVSSDGRRAYYVRRGQPPVRDRIHIVHNWFAELERQAAAGGN